MKQLHNPRRAIPDGRNRFGPERLSGKALEKRFGIAARENRKSELNDLVEMGEALTERSLVVATSRLHHQCAYCPSGHRAASGAQGVRSILRQ